MGELFHQRGKCREGTLPSTPSKRRMTVMTLTPHLFKDNEYGIRPSVKIYMYTDKIKLIRPALDSLQSDHTTSADSCSLEEDGK